MGEGKNKHILLDSKQVCAQFFNPNRNVPLPTRLLLPTPPHMHSLKETVFIAFNIYPYI